MLLHAYCKPQKAPLTTKTSTNPRYFPPYSPNVLHNHKFSVKNLRINRRIYISMVNADEQ